MKSLRGLNTGMAGWRVITAPSVSPSQVQDRWSPNHRRVEVVSSDVLPVYLSAPGSKFYSVTHLTIISTMIEIMK